jgi:outer membrane protein, multidrug efflux system
MANRIVTSVLAATLVAGCTMAPEYTRPDLPVAGEFPTQPAEEGGTPAAALGWRTVFGDARLQALIGLALENNRDLRVAVLNVDRARALYRIERSDQLPTVNATASGTVQGLPGGISPFGAGTLEQYTVGVGVTAFELDVWGRVRSLTDAALEQFLASEEAARSVHLAIVAEVASAYLTERALDEQLEIARETLSTVEESFGLTARGTELGRGSELDLRTAETQVLTARYNLALLEQRRAQAANAVVFLIGRPLPADLPEPLPLAEQQFLEEIPAGLPSDLLQRRPDIRAAEHELLAANANIGAARAAFFPTISLTGFGGTTSRELGGLFGGDTGTWSFSPQINLPLFTGGRLRANLDAAEIAKSIEVAQYERAIQVAFREVADALVARDRLAEQLEAQSARVAAEERRYELSEMRYRAGVDSYVTLLTAQRDLYTAQQQLIDTQRAQLANIAQLYKALGGGWNENTETAQGTQQPADG